MSLAPLKSLRAFASAAKHENYVKAAAELNMTPAAVSQHVRAVEHWLGSSVFVRGRRGVALTVAGREFARIVADSLRNIEEGARLIRGRKELDTVTVECIPSIAIRWLIPRLPLFSAIEPHVRLHLLYGHHSTQFDDATVDLRICYGERRAADWHKLLSGEVRPTCSTDFAARHPDFRAEGLVNAPLLHDETTDVWRRWFAEGGVRLAAINGPLFADFTLMIGSVLGGQGIGLCPTSLVREEIDAGSLVILDDRATNVQKGYWLVRQADNSSAAERFGNWVEALFDEVLR